MTSYMSESDFQTTVIDLCRLMHLRVAHFRPARTAKGWVTPVAGDGAGFPDLVIAGPGGVLFRELKQQKGALSGQQAVWLDALKSAGADAGIWRPSELKNGTVVATLGKLARRVESG